MSFMLSSQSQLSNGRYTEHFASKTRRFKWYFSFSLSIPLLIYLFFQFLNNYFWLTESHVKGNKRMKDTKEKVTDYAKPFAIRGLLKRLDSGGYGSVTDDIRSLFYRRAQLIHPCLAMHPTLSNEPRGREMSFGEGKCNVIDLDDDEIEGGGDSVGNVAVGRTPVVVIDSDDDKSNENRMVGHFQGIVLPKPEGQFSTDVMVSFNSFCGSGDVRVLKCN